MVKGGTAWRIIPVVASMVGKSPALFPFQMAQMARIVVLSPVYPLEIRPFKGILELVGLPTL